MAMPARDGLSGAEAALRLRQHGFNELPQAARRSLWRIIAEILRQPMFALLLAAGGIYAVLGEPLDGLVLLAFATLSVAITVIQETRSEHVLEALRNLASPRALVIRDGRQQRIPGREVVPGDTLLLAEGDRVPADGRLEECNDLLIDEAILTGESVPVRKSAGATPGADSISLAFAGTLVVRGTGLAQVCATGLHSELGKIGVSLEGIALEQPRLQRQLRWLVRDFAIFGAVVAIAVVLLLGWRNGEWLQALLSGIAVGMSALPEEFPLVLAVFMAMGAWRISRAHVLTRRAAAIETLGSATILCTDKTGTLTENRMQVQLLATETHVWRLGSDAALEPALPVLRAAAQASALHATDPMDQALHAASARDLAEIQAGALVQSYGLRPELLATTNVWDEGQGNFLRVFAKGAPEAIVELCRLPPERKAAILAQMDRFAREGLRLLAVAEGTFDPASGPLPAQQNGFCFSYLGLVGFADPLRAHVADAVRECQTAGIRVIMITGDHPLTAQAIARQAGIDHGEYLTGDAIEALEQEELARKIRGVSVFCRIRPTQKLRIVEALKADGEIVAMTGDGVNDAPAMKAAHIGVAMGGRGTDVAREAAALVLLDDNFVSLITTIRLGRRIYDNMQKAIQYIVAVHIPIAGLAVLPLMLGLPAMLTPIQIAFLEMVIDPACSIVFESEPAEADIMRRRPRDPAAPLLSKRLAIWAAMQGLAALALVAVILFAGIRSGMTETTLRAMVFTALVAANLALILVNRPFLPSLRAALAPSNSTLGILAALVLALLAVALTWAPARLLFHFGSLSASQLAACVVGAGSLVVFLEICKRLMAAIPER
jgi:Ca2+-transporting ATPase